MAKPGDVVEFRSGLHGIDAPQNIGILLTRERRKGVPWVRIMTHTGPLDIKQEHLLRRTFRDRFDGRLQDDAEVQARIRQLVRQHSDGGLPEEAEDDLGALEEALWETCSDGEPRRDEDIARLHYGEPSALQLKQVREVLERCRRPGTGRFEATDKGDIWKAWSDDERQAMRTAWEDLARLRAKLIQTEETEEGRVFHRVPLADAGLDDQDAATLRWVRAAMEQFIEHDGIPDRDVAGIGGLGAVKAFGLDLHRQLGFLAGDWIRSDPTTRSSDYVHFLLESGQWSPDDAVQALMRRHVNQEPFFEHVPDEEAEARADALPEPDISQDPEREDLRHLECFTIDPPDAKDFDDAVGIEDLDGGTRLWVHIADVSHYVTPGSRLDKHAKDRATSVYLPGRVLPMLPHRIADHLCSLRDDGDRFAMSVHMDVDADGRIADAGMHVSMIRVDENLSYDEALRRRDAGDQRFVALFDLAKRMRQHRRGMDIDMGEIRVSLDEGTFAATEKRGNDATQMIETFMVAANEAVARFMADRDLGLLYRCHPLPDASKAERFVHQLETIGLDIDIELPKVSGTKEAAEQSMLDLLKSGGGKLQLGGGAFMGGLPDEPDDAADETAEAESKGFAAMTDDEREAWLKPFRDATDAIATLGQATAEVASLKMLACMGRAYYTPDNEGHFGLGSTHYCHFTSPIRRYPDLVTHRNLKAHLRNETLPHPAEDLQRMCDHCSDQERAAAELERRVKSACLVLASLDGEQSGAARVTGIIPSGLFVRRDDGIEARISGRDLPGGPYQVDEWESMLFLSDREAPQRFDPESLKELGDWYDEELGERRRVRAQLADRITIRLAGRDVADGKTGAELLAWRA